jgi:periplasmic protein TonB
MSVSFINNELTSFETYIPSSNSLVERIFITALFASLAFFLGAGWHYRNVKASPETASVNKSAVNAEFIIEEPPSAPPVEKRKPPAEKNDEAVKAEPIDLTKQPLLNQEKNEAAETPPPQRMQQPVRRVYGLKKVYSTGIGASGGASDAIIGKIGNTLSTAIDTIQATKSDLLGTPVSVTTVTSYPRLTTTVKPEYTKEMLENRIEGLVRVKILVDIDGKVKQLVVLDDLGYGAKTKVAEACFKMVFEPAMIAAQAVSTWIMMRIRFQMIDG